MSKRICTVEYCKRPIRISGLCISHHRRFIKYGDPNLGPEIRPIIRVSRTAPEATFWNQVNKNGPIVRPELTNCWTWEGQCNSTGYGLAHMPPGSTTYAADRVLAHRAAWFYVHGFWPDKDLFVCHACDNPLCVKASLDDRSHLFLGTHQDNMADKMNKKRHAWGAKCGSQSKLNTEAVLDIRSNYVPGEPVKHELAKKFAIKYGVSVSAIDHAMRGRTWKDVPRI